MKKEIIAKYLQGICPLFDDLSYSERLEYEKEGANISTEFIGHELRNGMVTWKFKCEMCGTIHEREYDIDDDFIYLSSAPTDEPYEYVTALSCAALIIQLRNTFGKEPEGARLAKKFEGGTDGYEVVCYFNMRFPESYAYAMYLEGNLPEKWSKSAKDFLTSHVE